MNLRPKSLSSHEPLRSEEECRALRAAKSETVFVNFYQHWSEDGRMGGQTCEPFTDVCNETAYGTTQWLSFAIRVF